MIALALALALFAQPPADAWREHPEFLRGSAAFEAQRWDEAARAFEAAYAAHPRPELLWAQAQALRFGGRCEDALPLYERFLATGPTTEEIEDANTNIVACREVVGVQADAVPVETVPPPQPAVEPSSPPPAPTVRPADVAADVQPPPRKRPRSVGRDPWGHGLLWSGVGVAGVGAGLLAAGHARRVDARDSSTELEYQQTFAGAPALGQAGIAVLVTGAALITAGVVRFAVLSARARRGNATMARLSARGW